MAVSLSYHNACRCEYQFSNGFLLTGFYYVFRALHVYVPHHLQKQQLIATAMVSGGRPATDLVCDVHVMAENAGRMKDGVHCSQRLPHVTDVSDIALNV